jgi:hypothetical protein
MIATLLVLDSQMFLGPNGVVFDFRLCGFLELSDPHARVEDRSATVSSTVTQAPWQVDLSALQRTLEAVKQEVQSEWKRREREFQRTLIRQLLPGSLLAVVSSPVLSCPFLASPVLSVEEEDANVRR